MLGQGACIKDVVARGGPYRPLVSQLRPIAGPILATVFDDDKALLAYDIWPPDSIATHGFTEAEPFEKMLSWFVSYLMMIDKKSS